MVRNLIETKSTSIPENRLIFNFLVDALKIAGAPYNIINNELIMAQCRVDVPRSFFRPARTENLNLQMVCEPELLEKYPGSELVSRGSFRLQWLIEGICRRGRIAKATFAYELDYRRVEREIMALVEAKRPFFFKQPFLVYHPHLLVNFKVSFQTDEKFDELYCLSTNLVNGEIAANLIHDLIDKKLAGQPPKKNLEKRQISYRDGFEALLNHLKWQLQNHDSEWIKAARARWEEEVKYLEDYYRGNLDEEQDHQSFYRRMAEVYRKFRPVIRIQIINMALLFLPLIRYTIEPDPGQPELQAIIYDPVRRKLKKY